MVGAWLKLRPDGTYDPDLAESVEIVNPTTITVHMRSGLQFSDATPLDAQAAATSILRTRDAKPRGLRTAEMGTITAVTVDNPTQFTVKLSVPQAGLIFPLFADAEMSPVSPKTIAIPGDHSRDVVMAGPFKMSSYQPGNQVQMVKNDLYWNADQVRLAGITYINAESNPGGGQLAAVRPDDVRHRRRPAISYSDLACAAAARSRAAPSSSRRRTRSTCASPRATPSAT